MIVRPPCEAWLRLDVHLSDRLAACLFPTYLYIYIHLSLSLYIYIYRYVYTSLALSLSIYIYIHMHIHMYTYIPRRCLLIGWPVCLLAHTQWRRALESQGKLRECLSTGNGLWFSTNIYGSKREKTVFHKTYRKPVLFLQKASKSSKISGNLREFTGECDLGILYSTSLL